MKNDTFERNGNQALTFKIHELKEKLRNTDYMAIKYGEGELTLAEYTPVKEQRRAYRAEINRLQTELNK